MMPSIFQMPPDRDGNLLSPSLSLGHWRTRSRGQTEVERQEKGKAERNMRLKMKRGQNR